MNTSDLWDFTFFWQIYRNMMGTVSPFVMIFVAVGVVGMLVAVIVGIVVKARK
ncbi:hypothetical protein D1872_152810 [compost metagenome]